MRAPTEKQLGQLQQLGYGGPAPVTLREASLLIEAKLGGAADEVAEKLLTAARADAELRSQLQRKQQLAHVKAEIQEMIRSNHENRRDGFEGQYAGFRFVKFEEQVANEERPYLGAFLPLRVAEQYPYLLLVETLNYEEVLGDDVIAKGTPTVIGPGQFKRFTGKRSNSPLPKLLVRVGGLLFVLAALALGWHFGSPYLLPATSEEPEIAAAPAATEPDVETPAEVAVEPEVAVEEPAPMVADTPTEGPVAPVDPPEMPVEPAEPIADSNPEASSAADEAIEAAKWRDWTAGTFQARLKFIALIGETVRLEREDGTTLEVPLTRLSAEDVAWIRNRGWLEGER